MHRSRFNPRAPCGARPPISPRVGTSHSFNPRTPCGARPTSSFSLIQYSLFQSTRPVRGATSDCQVPHPALSVSIHAPRAGRDLRDASKSKGHFGFNPRAPCGARHRSRRLPLQGVGFNPRAPCGARPLQTANLSLTSGFNPRAPCGARRIAPMLRDTKVLFQSTRPVRGATWCTIPNS